MISLLFGIPLPPLEALLADAFPPFRVGLGVVLRGGIRSEGRDDAFNAQAVR